MKSVSRFLGLLMLLLIYHQNHAQHFNFSQYSFTDQRINPALVGIGSYWKISGLHRQQNTGPDFDIKSTSLAASYPLVKPNDGGILGGLGFSLLDDKAGEGKAFKVQEFGLSYAMQVKPGLDQQLAVGASIFGQTRKFSFEDFVTNSQYIPDRGFDRSLDSGENFDELRRTFKRINLGLYWEVQNSRGIRTEHFGISVLDINRPREAFIDSTFRVNTTYLISTGFMFYEAGKMSLYPEVLYTHNGKRNLLNVGMNLHYDLANQGYLEIKGRYLLGREFIAAIQFAKDDFRVGFSYDIPVNRNNVANQSAFEFGFEFRGLVKSKSRSKRRKKKDNPQPPKAKLPVEKEEPIEIVDEKVSEEEPEIENEIIKEVVQPEESKEVSTDTGAEGLEFEPFVPEKITKRLGFEFNQAELTEEMATYLNGLAKRLEEQPYLKVDILGHTDDIGNQQVNQRLSFARANGVKRYLVGKGISAERISAEGRGELEPVGSNSTDEGRALNRRVELVIHR